MEAFNPEFVPRLARRWGAGGLDDYVALARRQEAPGGVWSFEATPSHLWRLFGAPRRFAALAAPDAVVWLLREDIVAQAVSSARRLQGGPDHHRGDEAEVAAAEEALLYRPRDILARLLTLRALERAGERWLAALAPRPLRLSAERTLAVPPEALAARVAAHAGVALPPLPPLDPGHRKLGGERNAEFARRFRRDHAALVRLVERGRRPLLAALDGPEGW